MFEMIFEDVSSSSDSFALKRDPEHESQKRLSMSPASEGLIEIAWVLSSGWSQLGVAVGERKPRKTLRGEL